MQLNNIFLITITNSTHKIYNDATIIIYIQFLMTDLFFWGTSIWDILHNPSYGCPWNQNNSKSSDFICKPNYLICFIILISLLPNKYFLSLQLFHSFFNKKNHSFSLPTNMNMEKQIKMCIFMSMIFILNLILTYTMMNYWKSYRNTRKQKINHHG
jgi:hypothetical protein